MRFPALHQPTSEHWYWRSGGLPSVEYQTFPPQKMETLHHVTLWAVVSLLSNLRKRLNMLSSSTFNERFSGASTDIWALILVEGCIDDGGWLIVPLKNSLSSDGHIFANINDEPKPKGSSLVYFQRTIFWDDGCLLNINIDGVMDCITNNSAWIITTPTLIVATELCSPLLLTAAKQYIIDSIHNRCTHLCL